MTLLRGTLHLVTAQDALSLRALMQPALERTLYGSSPLRTAVGSVDLEALFALFQELFEERPRTRAQLVEAIAERWPDHDASSLGYAMYLLPTVQVTPRGIWGQTGPSAFTTVERWLGRPLEQAVEPDELIVRYLSAFGPSTVADAQTWSGLTGLKVVFERLRPRLRTLRDERGRELFDVPGSPFPDPDVPTPVRFLPEYDNAVLGHADRSRIATSDISPWTDVGWGMVLVDGFTAARWKLERERSTATLLIEPFRTMTRDERAAVSEEAERLLDFLAPDADPRATRIAARR
jgi:hypothetical protein